MVVSGYSDSRKLLDSLCISLFEFAYNDKGRSYIDWLYEAYSLECDGKSICCPKHRSCLVHGRYKYINSARLANLCLSQFLGDSLSRRVCFKRSSAVILNFIMFSVHQFGTIS